MNVYTRLRIRGGQVTGGRERRGGEGKRGDFKRLREEGKKKGERV